MENPIKMDDLGGKPPIFGNIHLLRWLFFQLKFHAPTSGRQQLDPNLSCFFVSGELPRNLEGHLSS